MDPLTENDLYELLGIERTGSDSEIRKAYRKKALSCHPDKQPDNPRAAELFHELTRALEILTDAAARAAYDKVLDTRERAKLRVKELDARRKRLKEDLEAREDAYRRSVTGETRFRNEEEKFKAEVERLRKEGSKQVEEEIALVTKRIREELREKEQKWKQGEKGEKGKEASGSGPFRIKIKWKIDKEQSNVSRYDRDDLYQIFSKYGRIVALVISTTGKGRAIVEYELRANAEAAADRETGYASAPLIIEKLWGAARGQGEPAGRTFSTSDSVPMSARENVPQSTPVTSTVSSSSDAREERNKFSDAEFEELVLGNLRKAEEKKRLAAVTGQTGNS